MQPSSAPGRICNGGQTARLMAFSKRKGVHAYAVGWQGQGARALRAILLLDHQQWPTERTAVLHAAAAVRCECGKF